MNKQCCDKCYKSKVWGVISLFKCKDCPCHSKESKEEVSKCCGAVKMNVSDMCSKCYKHPFEPQEPMEWIKQFYDLYVEGRKNHAPISYIEFFKAREFLYTQIKQAEERERNKIGRLINSTSSDIEQLDKVVNYLNSH